MDSIEEVLNDAVNKASKGMSNKIDAHLLSDLKRMSELGVLEIHQKQPDFKPFDESKNSLEVTQEIRLYFKGEETIISQSKQLAEQKAEIERLKDGIKKGVESLKDKHKAFLGTKGEEARQSFKLGLSWGWGAFEDLINEQHEE